MISFREGDLFDCGIPDIAHGVNCKGVMGAGIAAEFRRRYPKMYESYRRRCNRGELLPGEIVVWQPGRKDGPHVFNLATQDEPGANAEPWMITAATGRMITEARDYKIREIAMPMIGCGIGGLTETDLVDCLSPYSGAPVDLVVVRWKAPDIPPEQDRAWREMVALGEEMQGREARE